MRCHVSFNRVQRKMQLVRRGAIGGALRNEVDDLELGIGETVPTCPCPLADNAPFRT